MNKKEKGFTLVELLVVIAILAILAAVSVVGYISFTEKANKSVDEQLCHQYNTLLEGYAASEDDITLAEFIVYLGEEGINHNRFETSSKNYEFAYDASNKTCVLIDSKTSEVKFPSNYSISNDGLWQIYPTDQNLNKDINNYLLISSIDDFLPKNTPSNLKLDLNNNVVLIKNEVSFNLNLLNGYLVNLTNKELPNINLEDVTVNNTNSSNDWGAVIDSTSFIVKLEDGIRTDDVLIISDKLYATTDLDGKTATFDFDKSNLLKAGIKKVLIKDSSFTNFNFSLGHSELDFELDHCKIQNIDNSSGYCVDTTDNQSNITIKNCEFANVIRGINLFPTCENKKIIIENNTFNLKAFESDKGERKDTAIQLAYPRGYATDNFSVGDVIIKNNKVLKAVSLIQLHGTLIGTSGDMYPNYEDKVDKILSILTIEKNITSNNIPLVILDPGIASDFENCKDDALEAMNKVLEKVKNLIR